MCYFWRITDGVHNKGYLVIALLVSVPKVLSFAFDKVKLFGEIFPGKSSFDDSGGSVCGFLSRTKLKLHNISVTREIFKKVLGALYLSKWCGPDYIPALIPKN